MQGIVDCFEYLFAHVLPVFKPSFIFADTNRSLSIGKVKKGSSRPSRKATGYVETKEPYARLSSVADVASDIDFRKITEVRELGTVSECDAFHVERHDCDPGFTFVKVNLQLRRNSCSKIIVFNFPVDKSEIEPGLGKQPVFLWKWPGAMVDLAKGGMIE